MSSDNQQHIDTAAKALDKVSAKPKRSAFDKILRNLQRLDPSALSAASQRLCKERELTDGILKALKEAVIVVDREGTIEHINQSALTMLGIKAHDEAQGLAPTLWRAVPELAGILGVGADGVLHQFKNISHCLEISYPQERIVRLSATVLEDLDLLLIVLSDITDEHASASKNIEEAQTSALTSLAASVAHELGNPLNALEIHLQLVERALKKEDLQSGEKIARNLKVAQGELKRLDQIIRNFLQALRPNAIELKPTDVMATLEEVLEVLREQFQGARIGIEVQLPHIIPMIHADADALKQVYFNLLKNAREAMNEGGTLNIVAKTSEESLEISFIDNGHGISAENLTHLFEPHRTTKAKGSGLGLMIAQKIMRGHGGSITVESQPKQGTTVKLIFPLRYRRLRPLQGRATPQPQLPKPQA